MLWDHCFESPHKHLEARRNQSTPESVAAGTVIYRIAVGNFGKLEVYDYPGDYAQRFDGVDEGAIRTRSHVCR